MRILALACSLAAAAGLAVGLTTALTGCSGGSESGGGGGAGEIKILWAEWEPSKALQKLGDEYKAKTGVSVRVVQKPWDPTGFPAAKQKEFDTKGTTYDLIIGDSQWIGQGVVGGHYADVTELYTQNPELFKDVAPAALTYYCEYPKGSKKYYGVPCESDAMAFAYRKDLFEDPKHKDAFKKFLADNKHEVFELDVPKTWDQLYWIARYFKQGSGIEDMAGIVMPTTPGYDQATMSFMCMLWSFGGDWGDQEKNVVSINTPGSVEALKFMKSLVDLSTPQGSNMDYGPVQQAFANGKSAMALTYFAFFPDFNSSNANRFHDRTGYFNVPAGPKGRFTALGGQGMSMNNHISAERKNRTLAFMKWFSEPDTQKRWAQLGGYTANLAILNSGEFQKATPYNPLFAEAFGMMKDFWNTPEYDQLLQAAQSNVTMALQGKKAPEQAIADMQAQQEKVVKQAR